jgi:prepilin-type N-terminal cleavage/methylation domain-containing protein
MNQHPQEQGFTIVEVMIVVAIIGILSSVSVYAFQHFSKKSKASEANVKLQQIAQGAMAWFSIEKLDKKGKVLPQHFPHKSSPALPGTRLSRSTVPTMKLCGKGTRDGRYPIQQQQWKVSPWKQLKFHVNHEHYFQFVYAAAGTGTKATFEAVARADLNCNGIRSHYQLRYSTSKTGEVVRHPIVVLRALE